MFTDAETLERATVNTLLSESFQSYSSRTALSNSGALIRYDQLERRADGIAAMLTRNGCGYQSRVCLAVQHGLDMVAAILAVLKIGATYIPLDKRHPVDRLRFIVSNSAAAVVLHSNDSAGLCAQLGAACLSVEDARNPMTQGVWAPVNPGDLAYILYTSGTTGNPKGVGITHANLLNYSGFAARRYFRERDDRIALYSTLAFDFTVTCILPPLLAGASIALFDGVDDPMVISTILDDPKVTVIKITPSYLTVLSNFHAGQTSIRRLIVGGEDLSGKGAAEIYAQLGGVDIINEYGPTEATVGCIVHTFDPAKDLDGSVPIGEAIPNMHALVAGPDGVLSETAPEGELYLGGASVAPGYIDLPEKSAAAFLNHPLVPGHKVYRTGDLVRRNASGQLVFAGRIDGQVKIRGNRVELTEVQNAMLRHRHVRAAYVTTVREHGTQSLVAIYTAEQPLEPADLNRHMQEIVPPYMVPSLMSAVSDIPLSTNQKVDRTAVLRMLGKSGETDT
ncbi:amino acid adenylation domain-containing protein [Leisingera daeponensis]|uniref:amino acid adenylation domain-containing protein n=1 Tax=Leisingera daeponensis TaxID=405746 RepID=UPI0004131F24|nr:amino acid adenylation domain-containing protein [Leisingera daeponensis]